MSNEGLSYVDTSECYGHPCLAIQNIASAFEENGQSIPKHRGNVCCPILQDERTQWLAKRLHANPNITIESLHCQLNEVFLIPTPHIYQLCFKYHLK
jgi:hypothetical protein